MSKTNRTTPSQRDKIKLIEKELGIIYKGNITNQIECQYFIDEYYEDALDSKRNEAEYQELFGNLLKHE